MVIYLIRHGMTAGNQKKRYIGTTDESLCPKGVEKLQKIKNLQLYPVPDFLYVSPMLRCRETAEILFPGKEYVEIADFRECDFGEFENKNYMELSGNLHYQQWIDSNGQLPFPGGESREGFQQRNIQAFRKLEEAWQKEDRKGKITAIVAHGGTIMSILQKAGVPAGSYYDFQVGNGEGYRLEGSNGAYCYSKIEEKSSEIQ